MNALALRKSGGLAATSRLGAGMALQTLAGSVSAFFALEHFDQRRGVAIYSLRVVNRTSSALVCRTLVISRDGDAALAYPLLIEIEPLSTTATQIPLWPKDYASFDRALAEVAGDGVHCIVEAAAPRRVKPVRSYGIAAAVLVAGLSLLTVAGIVRTASPRIAAFAVPPEAIAGTTVQAEYSTSGLGRVSYEVIAPNGHALQRHGLNDRSGAVSISLPGSAQPGGYAVQLAMAGPLGNVTETRVLNAVVPKSSGARIDDISLRPAVAKPGQSVNVAYTAYGDSGYVRLVGSDGTIWAEKPFSNDGQTQLVVPAVANQPAMHVLLRVTKGNTAAQSMAGIVIADAPAQSSAAPQVAGDDDPNLQAAASTNSDSNGTFDVVNRTVRSGDRIRVHIISPRNGMRIALLDAQSHEVQGQDVGAQTDVITLQAPRVSIATRYTIVASFTDGFGQESVVQPVTILP
jgi:hypothetical protein